MLAVAIVLLIITPANCKIPKIGDNVTIFIDPTTSLHGIIRDITPSLICIEQTLCSGSYCGKIDSCIGTGAIQELTWNDQLEAYEKRLGELDFQDLKLNSGP